MCFSSLGVVGFLRTAGCIVVFHGTSSVEKSVWHFV